LYAIFDQHLSKYLLVEVEEGRSDRIEKIANFEIDCPSGPMDSCRTRYDNSIQRCSNIYPGAAKKKDRKKCFTGINQKFQNDTLCKQCKCDVFLYTLGIEFADEITELDDHCKF
jgi:hypothetical protein